MATLYNNFFDMVILPMLNPSVVARALQKKKPDVAAGILGRMASVKAVKVIMNWSLGVRVIILNEMGEGAVRLLSSMPPEDKAQLLSLLKQNIVKRYCRDLNQDEVEVLMDYWGENDLKTIVHRLSPKVAASVVSMCEEPTQFAILNGLKPWVQQPLMESMDVAARARIVEQMEYSAAIDLFSRYEPIDQGAMIEFLSAKRQHEIFNVLGYKNIAAILAKWELEKVKEVLLNLDEERQRQVYMKLPEDVQYTLFPLLSERQQVLVLNICDPMDALKYLDTVTRDENDKLMRLITEEQATSIRMATLMR